jgi:TRAP-type uncharacterized transport system fused permease subunit
VALAGYAAASIAGTPVMRTSLAAFRFALVGFTLPFIFVYRPQLLMIDPVTGGLAAWPTIIEPLLVAVLGVLAFAAGLAGYLLAPLSALQRAVAFLAAALLLAPGPDVMIAGYGMPVLDAMGLVSFGVLLTMNLAARNLARETTVATGT